MALQRRTPAQRYLSNLCSYHALVNLEANYLAGLGHSATTSRPGTRRATTSQASAGASVKSMPGMRRRSTSAAAPMPHKGHVPPPVQVVPTVRHTSITYSPDSGSNSCPPASREIELMSLTPARASSPEVCASEDAFHLLSVYLPIHKQPYHETHQDNPLSGYRHRESLQVVQDTEAHEVRTDRAKEDNNVTEKSSEKSPEKLLEQPKDRLLDTIPKKPEENAKDVFQRIMEREAQFVIRNGRKHHMLPASQLPYPRSYDKEAVDHDIWCMMWMQQLSEHVVSYFPGSPPGRVLDLGCGTGAWILDAAVRWKSTHFIGLEIAPLQPDLELIDADLASRITWVTADFLKPLPFDNEAFDMIFISRISRGIPEYKWDSFMEEVARVLKPGGMLQMSEEELYFPGILRESEGGLSPEVPGLASAPPSTTYSNFPPPNTPLTESSLPSLGHSSAPTISSYTSDNDLADLHADPGSRTIPINPHDHSLLEHIYNKMHAARFINLAPLTLIGSLLPLHFDRVRSHPPLLMMFPPSPYESCNLSKAPIPEPYLRDIPKNPFPQPTLAETLHSLANPAPPRELIIQRIRRLDLALLKPNLDCSTPFLSVHDIVSGATKYVGTDMNRYEAIAPRATPLSAAPHQTVPAPEEPIWLRAKPPTAGPEGVLPMATIRDLVKDRALFTNMHFDARTLNLHASLRVQEVLACSEAMWEYVVDFQRKMIVQDIQTQPKGSLSALRHPFSRSNSMGSPSLSAPRFEGDPIKATLIDLTRSQFDKMLWRFKMDMQDCLGFGAVLQDRLGWEPPYPARTEERKEFNAMCKEWDKYQEHLHRSAYEHSQGKLGDSNPSFISVWASSDPDSRHESMEALGMDTASRRQSAMGSINASYTSRHASLSEPLAESPAAIPRSHSIPHHERLSRTFRMFVAYKKA